MKNLTLKTWIQTDPDAPIVIILFILTLAFAALNIIKLIKEKKMHVMNITNAAPPPAAADLIAVYRSQTIIRAITTIGSAIRCSTADLNKALSNIIISDMQTRNATIYISSEDNGGLIQTAVEFLWDKKQIYVNICFLDEAGEIEGYSKYFSFIEDVPPYQDMNNEISQYFNKSYAEYFGDEDSDEFYDEIDEVADEAIQQIIDDKTTTIEEATDNLLNSLEKSIKAYIKKNDGGADKESLIISNQIFCYMTMLRKLAHYHKDKK